MNVTWYDAAAYCNWRSLQEGLQPCYSNDGLTVFCDFTVNGYRPPTEAEWEYAAKGRYSCGYKYSGSNNLDEVAWYINNSSGMTHPVGHKDSNELNLYDMSGNVWEWCWDWFDYNYYQYGIVENPTGPNTRVKSPGHLGHLNQGGGCGQPARDVRSATRYPLAPDFGCYTVGFRVARSE